MCRGSGEPDGESAVMQALCQCRMLRMEMPGHKADTLADGIRPSANRASSSFLCYRFKQGTTGTGIQLTSNLGT